MILRRFFILGVLLPLVVNASPLTLKKNMSFVNARALLLKDKWRPVNVHKNENYALMGVEHELFKRNFKEFDSCSIDYSNCIMRYKRGDECLTVHTIGEKVKHMKVVQWTDECPGSVPTREIPSTDK